MAKSSVSEMNRIIEENKRRHEETVKAIREQVEAEFSGMLQSYTETIMDLKSNQKTPYEQLVDFARDTMRQHGFVSNEEKEMLLKGSPLLSYHWSEERLFAVITDYITVAHELGVKDPLNQGGAFREFNMNAYIWALKQYRPEQGRGSWKYVVEAYIKSL